ncbi:membrane protein of unknown function [Nitrospira moscoviensis]|uniref:DUF4124 domain-containing protein n=2 Tax=Nitrospira moscoviensis TaxID=42253 RepID=A0A0K2GCV5_NITMO|nr:membrane protein of unknown function [Nitrospira moscoviensis]
MNGVSCTGVAMCLLRSSRTACLVSALFLPLSTAQAVTIYSYVDDRGNPVYTDSPETIPEKYRARVKTHEQPGPKPPGVMESVQQTVNDQVNRFGFTKPSFTLRLEGLNDGQARILTYAGGAAVVLLLMMYLSKSQLVRMLGFCLLIVIGIGTPVLMYVSDGGPMDVLKQKATAAGQAQQDRLQQVPR